MTGIVDLKSATITSKGQITIPSEIRKTLMPENSKVAIITYDDRIEIRPMSAIEDKLGWLKLAEKSLKKVWDTPEEDEAWTHLQNNGKNCV